MEGINMYGMSCKDSFRSVGRSSSGGGLAKPQKAGAIPARDSFQTSTVEATFNPSAFANCAAPIRGQEQFRFRDERGGHMKQGQWRELKFVRTWAA